MPHQLNIIHTRLKLIKLLLSFLICNFIKILNRLAVATRYPEDLDKMIMDFTKEITTDYFNQTEDTLQWIKKELNL